ncbi:MAG: Uma2 family endonuclease [Verrucomicrobiota bacterium]|nr:Uma2 family endonuclease [Verrucomicrobiota bacterium]
MAELTYTPAPLTVHDYRQLPEGGPRYQLVDGDLHMAPSPNLFHQEISVNIAHLLLTYLDQNPIGKVLLAPLDVYLTETNVYQPDILFVANKNLHLLHVDGIHGAPDLVIEILSPSTSGLDLGSKKRGYARCGVLEFWAIYPVDRKVAVYDLRKTETEPQATWIEGDTFSCKLLPGLQLEVAKFFVR